MPILTICSVSTIFLMNFNFNLFNINLNNDPVPGQRWASTGPSPCADASVLALWLRLEESRSSNNGASIVTNPSSRVPACGLVRVLHACLLGSLYVSVRARGYTSRIVTLMPQPWNWTVQRRWEKGTEKWERIIESCASAADWMNIKNNSTYPICASVDGFKITAGIAKEVGCWISFTRF